MEVIEYDCPTSWNSNGMDWDNPDPGRADYVMAIRQALMERGAAAHVSFMGAFAAVSPWQAVSARTVVELLEAIRSLAPRFVDMDFADYREDMSDYQKMLSYGDLVEDDAESICNRAWTGLPLREGAGWLKAIKRAIDRMTVIRCNTMHGTSYSRSGVEHDPPFGESIGNAMQEAMEDGNPVRFSGTPPFQVYGWSGNTHWCCPQEGVEDSKDGYCGYAQSYAHSVRRIDNWLRGRAFNLLLTVKAERPTGPAPYSEVLDTSVFNSGGTGYAEGVSFLAPIAVGSDGGIDLDIGEPGSIPRNGTVPSSEFDEHGSAIKRHSAKTGYEARVWALMDYGVSGGFNFR